MNTQESENREEENEASDMILDTQKETENSQNGNDMILDSAMEIESSRNFENDGDQLSVPEQLVSDEKESSEYTELGGEEDSVMYVGSKIAPNELIEFDNNLVGVKRPQGKMKLRMF